MPGQIEGNPDLYKAISALLLLSFVLNALIIFFLNTMWVNNVFISVLGETKTFIFQLFFWGTSGATISSSVFLGNDLETNEVEKLKTDPDPMILRYPNKIDVWLYGQRIISSGFLSIFGAALLFAGLGYFDVSLNEMTTQHKVFLIVFSFIVGLYENRFLNAISNLSKSLFKKNESV